MQDKIVKEFFVYDGMRFPPLDTMSAWYNVDNIYSKKRNT